MESFDYWTIRKFFKFLDVKTRMIANLRLNAYKE